MSDNEGRERPLPVPPGRRKFGEGGGDPLLAEQIAMAAAEGRLDEFMEQVMPGNEHARALAMMAMMPGAMMPPGGFGMPAGEGPAGGQAPKPDQGTACQSGEAAVPDDVRAAMESGDLHALMGLLEREHRKRRPEGEMRSGEPVCEPAAAASSGVSAQDPALDPKGAELAAEEKEVLDALIRIAADNKVSVDWLILRAMKLYVREYGQSGRM